MGVKKEKKFLWKFNLLFSYISSFLGCYFQWERILDFSSTLAPKTFVHNGTNLAIQASQRKCRHWFMFKIALSNARASSLSVNVLCIYHSRAHIHSEYEKKRSFTLKPLSIFLQNDKRNRLSTSKGDFEERDRRWLSVEETINLNSSLNIE